MKIVVSAQGNTLDGLVSPVFARCPVYLFIETDGMAVEAVPNPALAQGAGAGIQGAQLVVNRGAQAVLTGNLGPNALAVLQAANIPIYQVGVGTAIRQAVEAFLAGKLQAIEASTAAARMGLGTGMGLGLANRRGSGWGQGQPVASTITPQSQGQGVQEAELSELRETLKGLRQQLAETMDRIEKLEGKVNKQA